MFASITGHSNNTMSFKQYHYFQATKAENLIESLQHENIENEEW